MGNRCNQMTATPLYALQRTPGFAVQLRGVGCGPAGPQWFPVRTAILFLLFLAYGLMLGHGADKKYSIAHIAEISPASYRAETYIQLASDLQKLDHREAIASLRRLATSDNDSHQAIILCRMLFTARAKAKFRNPMLGRAGLFGGTELEDWPLLPIEIVDGVPFLVTRGYSLAGKPEAAEWYLDYCIAECEWSPARYSPKKPEELRAALRTLLASKKWKKPDKRLDDFFAKQIQ
jgi:hypothetical protein